MNSNDPIRVALKRAEHGAMLALLVAVLALGGMIAIAPDYGAVPSGSPLMLAWMVQYWVSLGCVMLALAASCVGLYQLGRYVVVTIWPERFL